MIELRPAAERGHADHGWLDASHTFSFAGYLDPRHMGFRSLRVINEDRVQPRAGFPEHPHDNMEIVTHVLSGALAHRDSMGESQTIGAGEFQLMSAGTGVRHSEFNASDTDPVHLLQIWIVPAQTDTEPRYEQKSFADSKGLRLVVSPDGADGSLRIGQDARIYHATLDGGTTLRHDLGGGRGAWLQVTHGALVMNGTRFEAGDGAAIEDEPLLELSGGPAKALLFDLA